jgi:hypothetical protein
MAPLCGQLAQVRCRASTCSFHRASHFVAGRTNLRHLRSNEFHMKVSDALQPARAIAGDAASVAQEPAACDPERLGALAAAQGSVTSSRNDGSSYQLQPLVWPARSHGAGTLRALDVAAGGDGTSITLCGWVDKHRDMGGVCFFDVRDHTGLLQVGWCRLVWVCWLQGSEGSRRGASSSHTAAICPKVMRWASNALLAASSTDTLVISA